MPQIAPKNLHEHSPSTNWGVRRVVSTVPDRCLLGHSVSVGRFGQHPASRVLAGDRTTGGIGVVHGLAFGMVRLSRTRLGDRLALVGCIQQSTTFKPARRVGESSDCATSSGVGEPKLMTSLMMSAGSKENRTLGNRSRNSRRSSSFMASVLMPELDVSAIRNKPSSGPREK